jgi:hypothetical protein
MKPVNTPQLERLFNMIPKSEQDEVQHALPAHCFGPDAMQEKCILRQTEIPLLEDGNSLYLTASQVHDILTSYNKEEL